MAEETAKTTPEEMCEPSMQTIMLVAGTDAAAENEETLVISEQASKLGLSIYFVSN